MTMTYEDYQIFLKNLEAERMRRQEILSQGRYTRLKDVPYPVFFARFLHHWTPLS